MEVRNVESLVQQKTKTTSWYEAEMEELTTENMAYKPELLALRGTSAVIVAAASTTLVVQVLPRLVLASATALYVGLSLNLGCWWASLWLRLQTDGLAAHLPPSVRRALLHERPIDWLRRSDWTEMVLRARQMLPLLLLPDGELRHGLAQLPPRLRRRLERPGLAALLPITARQLLEPWASGPDLLRVRPLPISPLDVVAARPPAPASTTPNGYAHGTSASPAAAAVSAYRYDDDDEEEEEEADEVEEEADGELAAQFMGSASMWRSSLPPLTEMLTLIPWYPR